MTSTNQLTWGWSGWSLALSALVLLATIALGVIAWRRSGYRRSVGALELLRVLLVGWAAILLNQPEWTELYRPTEKPTIVVLYDDTQSMTTRDVVPTGGVSGEPLTRREAIANLIKPETWDSVRERMQVVIQPITESAEGGTDLFTPLSEAPKKQKNLQAIVLASDGDWNSGFAPVQAATQLRAAQIPVIAVPTGSVTRLPDVEILAFDVPTFGIVGKPVRIPITVESSLPRDQMATLILKTSNGETIKQELRVAAMGRTSEALVWKPAEEGEFTLSLELPTLPGELIATNNKMDAPIRIREEKLRVLVIESVPRWEYRYLRNALSRDPGVEVSCLLFHPGLSKVGGGNKDYIAQFPDGQEGLAPFDVIFLGDVGLDDNQLTPEQCRLIKGLVEHQASGLVFMPGWQGRQFSLMETDLKDLYPVVLDEQQPNGWGARTPNQFQLTETGRRSLLTKLADTEEDNAEVWENLPGFQWYAPVSRAKPGTEVLCVHKDATNEYGRLPLLVTRTYGTGKVLFMGTDGAWRWRKGVEDLYHYRFWGQVVRWMAYQRNMARGESMRLYYSPEQPQVGQTLALTANVMESSGEPLAKGDVTARIVPPSGRPQTLRFSSDGGEWGEFTSRYEVTEPGEHQVVLACAQTGATLEAKLFVQGSAQEKIGKPARPEVLEEIARVSHGRTLSLDKLDEVVNSVARLPEPEPVIRRVQLWSHPVAAGIWLVLVTVFWIGRKAVGLV